MNEQLAIMKHVRFGVEIDHGLIGLTFTVEGLFGASGQFLTLDDTVKLLKEYSITDVTSLNGCVCVVEISEDRTMSKFKRLFR